MVDIMIRRIQMSNYTQTDKQEVVKCYMNGESVKEILHQYKISKSTLYKWIHEQQDTVFTEKEISLREYHRLEQKLQKMGQLVQIMQQASCFSEITAEARLASAEELYNQDSEISIPLLCQALDIPKGTLLQSAVPWKAR